MGDLAQRTLFFGFRQVVGPLLYDGLGALSQVPGESSAFLATEGAPRAVLHRLVQPAELQRTGIAPTSMKVAVVDENRPIRKVFVQRVPAGRHRIVPSQITKAPGTQPLVICVLMLMVFEPRG